MLSVRNAVLTSIALLVLSLVFGVISLIGLPDSNGTAIDSYGTRRDGFRAVYELLSSFGVPVDRHIHPPSPDLPILTTLVLWMPHDDLVTNEPAYLERLLPWIERGGRLIVALPPVSRHFGVATAPMILKKGPSDIWSILKLDAIQPVSISLNGSEDKLPESKTQEESFESGATRRMVIRRAIEESIGMHPVKTVSIPAVASGSLVNSQSRIQNLQIPTENIGGLKVQTPGVVSGKIECQRSKGDPWIIAAAVPRGQGEIIVVAEPMLLTNGCISQADNSILAYDLITSGGRRVVFEEFYHGLSIRGNPLWLLTKSTYLTVTVAILALIALELWRRAIPLGPSIEAPATSRRTIIEYIDAMARFLNRGRASRPFLLGEIRAGTLRLLTEKLGLSYAVHDPEQIAAAMAKRSSSDADQFREAIRLLDAALAKGSSLSESNAVIAAQRISRCL